MSTRKKEVLSSRENTTCAKHNLANGLQNFASIRHARKKRCSQLREHER